MNEETRNRLIDMAIQAQPYEACGFIIDDDIIIECENVSKFPTSSFQMSGFDMVKKLEGYDLSRITGIWHTHPKGTNTPSKTDVHAMKIGAIHERWDYFIVTKDEVTQWNPKDYAPKEHSFWEEFSK